MLKTRLDRELCVVLHTAERVNVITVALPVVVITVVCGCTKREQASLMTSQANTLIAEGMSPRLQLLELEVVVLVAVELVVVKVLYELVNGRI